MCDSGMSFAGIGKSAGAASCVSEISSPLRVLQPCTSTARFYNVSGTVLYGTSIFWQSLYLFTSSRGPVSVITVIDNATTITQGLAIADPILVGWSEKELALFPTSYASSVAKQAGLKWGLPTPGSTADLPRETNPARSATPRGLSTGGKVGIAISVLGVVVLGALLFWLLLRRKRKGKQQEPQTAEIEGKPTPEMEDQDQELATRRWFLRGRWRSEVRAQERPGELDSRTVNIVPGPPVEIDLAERRDHPETRSTPVV